MNKLKISVMSMVLSTTLVLGLSSGMDDPNKMLYETKLSYCEEIKVGSLAQNFERLEALKAEKAAEEERIQQEEIERQKEQDEQHNLTSRGEQKTYLGEFTLTAYCSCAKCCGTANQPCANSQYPIEGVTIAADTSKYPFGTKLYIDGVGERVVMDTGSAIKGNKIDVYIADHQRANQFGRKTNVKVWIY